MKKILVNLSETDIEQLELLSSEENKSKSEFVRSALRAFFIRKKKEALKQKEINAQFESLNK